MPLHFASIRPSPLASSAPAFSTSSPAFGTSSTPTFGATSTLAFGSTTSTPFGGRFTFGKNPAFGEFGSPSPAQSSSFGSTFGQTKPTFRSQPFGASNQPAFGSTSTPTFGSTSTLAFGQASAASTPATSSSISFGNKPLGFGGSTFAS